MSYSFEIKADTVPLATRDIRNKFDELVLSQPNHLADKEAAVEAAQAMTRILVDPKPGQEVYVHVNGSLSWTELEDGTNGYSHASLNVGASIRFT
jgi:hypothetical protein